MVLYTLAYGGSLTRFGGLYGLEISQSIGSNWCCKFAIGDIILCLLLYMLCSLALQRQESESKLENHEHLFSLMIELRCTKN